MLTEPTPEQLAEAWRELAASGRHASCSRYRSLDEALDNPVAASLIRLHARMRAQGRQLLREHTPALLRPVVIAPDPPPHDDTPGPATARPRRRAKAPQLPALLDRKRQAAGDCDE